MICIKMLCLFVFVSSSSHYARKMFPDSDLILFGYGELIMAKFSGTKRWCRARVIGRDSDHSVKVIMSIHEDHVRARLRSPKSPWNHAIFKQRPNQNS